MSLNEAYIGTARSVFARNGCQHKGEDPPARPPQINTMSSESPECGIVCHAPTKRNPELKPNYQYEKRQRELEKKKKKAEKEHKKAVAPEVPPVPEVIDQPDKT
ncbi:MAG: hypothetical protein Q8K12_00185 [Thiobacillus sp.]|nr:hypothetical protein [Thiobacillus sp.]